MVPHHMRDYWLAFRFLNRCGRPSSGMGISAIPLSEIREYLDEHAIWGDERDDYIYFIRALDDKLMSYKPAEGGDT